MSKKDKISAQEAITFFDNNFIMIASLENPNENGCAEKCLKMLKSIKSNNIEENCKWIATYVGATHYKSSCSGDEEHFATLRTYCPYCGKKIKIVE